jgi:hypothetical protein
MTDESDLFRQLLADELERELSEKPLSNRPIDVNRVARKVAEEVIEQLRKRGISIVGLHKMSGETDDD